MADAVAMPERRRGGLSRVISRIKRAARRFSDARGSGRGRSDSTRSDDVMPRAPSPPQQTTDEDLLAASAAPVLRHESVDVQRVPATNSAPLIEDTAATPAVPRDHNLPPEAGNDNTDNNNAPFTTPVRNTRDHSTQTDVTLERYGTAYAEGEPTDIEEKAARTGEQKDSAVVPVSAALSPNNAPMEEAQAPPVPLRDSLEKDDDGADDNDPYITQLRYSVRRSSRPVIQLVLRPKMGATDGRLGIYEADGGDGKLERVYRRPRQRIRWTCDRCQTTTAASKTKRCAVCGHERCEDCVRSP
ncbi:hypothetical protein BDY17DRAFT_296956 [Neohortaea acidophila]|uniref:Uncharacterized protein n=1 Tax=Neohortaea acidophila TaxID=245834 RepID=A0A6A6PV90_9PEZI|nr:uncharacterized protein BDY17DRAFT_296956 [Neohortaea acidophila]KAF2483177.1 hypothetical protein BDY17DRAFT_296956 [Neohortaea acidophila]